MSRLFFTNVVEGENAYFDDHEYRHLQVMRVEDGETIAFTDGKGIVYEGVIHFSKRKTVAKIIRRECFSRENTGNRVTVGIAHSQWDREEILIEKATELGVSGFFFFPTRFSKYRELNLEKAHFTLRKAIKQSRTPYLPEYAKFDAIEDFTIAAERYTSKILLHPGSQKYLFNEPKPRGEIIIVVGPEGGFSEEEVLLLREKGFLCYSVSHRVLRLETAALCSFVWALLIP